MELPEIAVNLLVFQQISLPEALDSVVEAGCNVVELAYTAGYAEFDEHEAFTDEAADRILKELESRDLVCRSVAAHIDLGMEDAVERFQRRLAFAGNVGASILISNSSTVDRKDAFFEHIMVLSHMANGLGVCIGLENPGDGKGNLLGSGAAGAQLIDALGLPNVKLNYDFSNALSYSGMRLHAKEDCALAVPRSVNLHLKDFKRSEGSDKWDFCAIGEGEHDYATLIAQVKRLDNPPSMSLELPLHMRRKPNFLMERREDAIARKVGVQAIEQSIRNIEKLWAMD